MKTFYPFLMILFIICTSTQCRKTPPTESSISCDSVNSVYIPEDMKARFYFKEGTYWIYKNINTGETDSVWVYISNNGIGTVNRKVYSYGWNKCYEVFFYQTYNKKYFNQGIYYEQIGISLYPKDGNNLTNEIFEIQQLSPATNYRGSYHIYVEGNEYFNDQGAVIQNLDSIITSENSVYKDILNIYYPFGTTRDIYNNMYYSKNIGLIKFELSSDNSVWELIRFHIIQ